MSSERALYRSGEDVVVAELRTGRDAADGVRIDAVHHCRVSSSQAIVPATWVPCASTALAVKRDWLSLLVEDLGNDDLVIDQVLLAEIPRRPRPGNLSPSKQGWVMSTPLSMTPTFTRAPPIFGGVGESSS